MRNEGARAAVRRPAKACMLHSSDFKSSRTRFCRSVSSQPLLQNSMESPAFVSEVSPTYCWCITSPADAATLHVTQSMFIVEVLACLDDGKSGKLL